MVNVLEQEIQCIVAQKSEVRTDFLATLGNFWRRDLRAPQFKRLANLKYALIEAKKSITPIIQPIEIDWLISVLTRLL